MHYKSIMLLAQELAILHSLIVDCHLEVAPVINNSIRCTETAIRSNDMF